mmetsp:Transcript_25499/g.33317  ORF Transcript_25499/g.33317 Transcript_25499/m.33317 type:complete len:276 (-) Transcript_25499:104-931(-)
MLSPNHQPHLRPVIYYDSIQDKFFVWDYKTVEQLWKGLHIFCKPTGTKCAKNLSPKVNFPIILFREQVALLARKKLATFYDVQTQRKLNMNWQCDQNTLPQNKIWTRFLLLPLNIWLKVRKFLDPLNQLIKWLWCFSFGYVYPSKTLSSSWCFPSSEKERRRYLVFEDLWGKGYFVGLGTKYGADFVAYDGDPNLNHSFAAFKIVPPMEAGDGNTEFTIQTHDFIGFCRLQTKVLKKAVFVYVSSDDKLKYVSCSYISSTMRNSSSSITTPSFTL